MQKLLKTLFHRKPKGILNVQPNEGVTVFIDDPKETRPPGVYKKEISPGVWSFEVVEDPNEPAISKDLDEALMKDMPDESSRKMVRRIIDELNAEKVARHRRGKEQR